MRLLLHDVLATAPLVHPFAAGWLTPPLEVEARPALVAADLDGETAALTPVAELPALLESHRVAPEVAVVSEQGGLIAMRVPVRPDEVERAAHQRRLDDLAGLDGRPQLGGVEALDPAPQRDERRRRLLRL